MGLNLTKSSSVMRKNEFGFPKKDHVKQKLEPDDDSKRVTPLAAALFLQRQNIGFDVFDRSSAKTKLRRAGCGHKMIRARRRLEEIVWLERRDPQPLGQGGGFRARNPVLLLLNVSIARVVWSVMPRSRPVARGRHCREIGTGMSDDLR
jgi:hypothetical protein